MKTLPLLIFLLLLRFNITAQTNLKESQIALMGKQYQTCLDSGQYMLGCTRNFYYEMDSCLNLVYKQLMQRLDSTAKKELKTEEMKWLKERDEKFKSIDLNNKMEGQDGEMIRLDEKATFVKERVLTLIRRLYK